MDSSSNQMILLITHLSRIFRRPHTLEREARCRIGKHGLSLGAIHVLQSSGGMGQVTLCSSPRNERVLC